MYKLIHPTNVEDNWGLVSPFIQEALGEEEIFNNLEFIKNRAMQGMFQIWVGQNPVTNQIDIVLVTEGISVPSGENILILRWASGSNMEEWLFDIGLIENWAKEKGFDKIEIWGRRGWERKFRPLGYSHKFTIISRNLNIGVH